MYGCRSRQNSHLHTRGCLSRAVGGKRPDTSLRSRRRATGLASDPCAVFSPESLRLRTLVSKGAIANVTPSSPLGARPGHAAKHGHAFAFCSICHSPKRSSLHQACSPRSPASITIPSAGETEWTRDSLTKSSWSSSLIRKSSTAKSTYTLSGIQ